MVVAPRSTATWPLDPSKEEKQGWRHIRIKQMGKNASGQTHYLSLSGLEVYGTVTAVCEDQLGKTPPPPCRPGPGSFSSSCTRSLSKGPTLCVTLNLPASLLPLR